MGPSAAYNFFEDREAKRTPIGLFENNSAHSNGKIGLRFDKRLGEIHEIIGCSTYDPRIDPKDRRSNRTAITINGFTGKIIFQTKICDNKNFSYTSSIKTLL